MHFKNIEDVLDLAITKEEEAATFYRDVSSNEKVQDIRQMFLDFAAEEDKHKTLLLQLKSGIMDQTVDEYDWSWIIDLKRSNYVDDIEYRPGMPYNEILIMAAQREEKALAFYNECLSGAKGDEMKKVFKMLCQEEAKHKLALEDMLDRFMAEMGD